MRRYLVRWTARRFLLTRADAEEVAHEAIRQFIDVGATMGDEPGSVADALRSRVNGIAINRRRKKAHRAVCLSIDPMSLDMPDPHDPEDRVASVDWVRKAIGLLLRRVEGDEILSGMVEGMLNGVDTPAQLAQALGVDVRQVYNGRRRLEGHLQVVRACLAS